MTTDCIFCKLARGEIPAEKLLDVPYVFVIRDRTPLAPEHFLVIATEHYATLADAATVGPMPLVQLMVAAFNIGKKHCPNGYRLMINTGPHAGQTVQHAHIHVIGGTELPNHPGSDSR